MFVLGSVFVLLRVLFYFNFSLSDEYVMVFHCGFIYISLMIKDVENISTCSLVPCPAFVTRFVQVIVPFYCFCPFILKFIFLFYFFQYMACLFFLLMIPFEGYKFLILIKSNLLFFKIR